MIKEALQYVTEVLGNQRPKLEKVPDNSGRLVWFDEGSKLFAELSRFVDRKREVSNIESFAAMVLEEARRAKSDGDFMTVVFRSKGATFHLDDRDGRTTFAYERRISPQWHILVSAAEQYEHREFLRLLARLRPSIVNYSSIRQAFNKIVIARGATIDSSPVMEEGASGLSYIVEVKAAGGSAKGAVPGSMKFKLPYARGSKQQYELEAEVSLEPDEDSKTILLQLTVADHETVAEQAVADEVSWFRNEVRTLPKLSILEDY
jgi:hypothetical protein